MPEKHSCESKNQRTQSEIGTQFAKNIISVHRNRFFAHNLLMRYNIQ